MSNSTNCLLVSHARQMPADWVQDIDALEKVLAVICRLNQSLYVDEIRQMRWTIKQSSTTLLSWQGPFLQTRFAIECYSSNEGGGVRRARNTASDIKTPQEPRSEYCLFQHLRSSPPVTLFISFSNTLFQNVCVHSFCGGFGRRLIRFCKAHCSSRQHKHIHSQSISGCPKAGWTRCFGQCLDQVRRNTCN